MLEREVVFGQGQHAAQAPPESHADFVPRAATTPWRTAHITVRGSLFVGRDLDDCPALQVAVPGTAPRAEQDDVRIDIVLRHQHQLYDILQRLRELGTTLVGLKVDLVRP